MGCYQQLVIYPCVPPEVWGFHCHEETTAAFHSCSFEIPPPELTFTFHIKGLIVVFSCFQGVPVNPISHKHGLSPGCHHLHPCSRHLGPLGQRSGSIPFATTAVPYIGL